MTGVIHIIPCVSLSLSCNPNRVPDYDTCLMNERLPERTRQRKPLV